jgi:hypothetical protein
MKIHQFRPVGVTPLPEIHAGAFSTKRLSG